MKQSLQFYNGVLHSPYFIFVRASGRLTDHDILHLLNLNDFTSCPPNICREPCLYITQDDEWIHIADDWFYSLWHKGRRNVVDALHANIPDVPIFACSVGDADWSFDFAYYSAGKLVRRYILDDPHHNRHKRILVEDFGQPLPGEKKLSDINIDEQKYVLSLARGLGVRFNHRLDLIRCYAKSSCKNG